jgi:hypothetical protein
LFCNFTSVEVGGLLVGDEFAKFGWQLMENKEAMFT